MFLKLMASNLSHEENKLWRDLTTRKLNYSMRLFFLNLVAPIKAGQECSVDLLISNAGNGIASLFGATPVTAEQIPSP